MLKVYLSHPFTFPGNKEENRIEARRIAAKLTKKYKNIMVINPLDCFTYMEGDFDYKTILSRCCQLMDMCDVVYMSGDWQRSKGCNVELSRALNKIEILALWQESQLAELSEGLRRRSKAYSKEEWKWIDDYKTTLQCNVLLGCAPWSPFWNKMEGRD